MLSLIKLMGQVERMGHLAAANAGSQRRTLPIARELLHRFADNQDLLCQIATSDAGRQLRCAAPAGEPLDLALPAPPRPKCITLIATDGSQIYPDRHALALYYVINAGSIILRFGGEPASETSTEPQLFFSPEELYPGGWLISPRKINLERNLVEMETLVTLALREPTQDRHLLALLDGSLLAWIRRTTLPDQRQEQIVSSYLNCLGRMRTAALPAAGFISRPYSAEVVALLYLAQLEPEQRTAPLSLRQTEFSGLSDAALFGFLQPGERSALFVRGPASNNRFRAAGHTVHCYYLNTGSDISRVELPAWVAGSPQALDLSHAALYDQCRINRGYPYVLTRADELAFISGAERQALESMITGTMLQHGLTPRQPSPKAQQKAIARQKS